MDPKIVYIRNLSRSGRHENHLTTSEFIKKRNLEKKMLFEKVKQWELKQQVKLERMNNEQALIA